MKIALKPNVWLVPISECFDFLVLSGKQLLLLMTVVFVAAFAKVYQAYWTQLQFTQLEQQYHQYLKENTYRSALLLEKSTLLKRVQVLSEGRHHFHMILPKKVVYLSKGRTD